MDITQFESGQAVLFHVAQSGKAVAVFADLAKGQHLAAA